MAFSVSSLNRPDIDGIYEKSMRELDDFFELWWKYNRPQLFLVPDRAAIDSLRWEKTEPWLVGWSIRGNVYVLSDENYEKESNHTYSEAEYSSLVKHELAHCFTHAVSGYARLPVWISEGISIHLSWQNERKKRPASFSSFLEYHENGWSGVYAESGFAVEFLITKFGKAKLLEYLRNSKGKSTREEFDELFRKTYGSVPDYGFFRAAGSVDPMPVSE